MDLEEKSSRVSYPDFNKQIWNELSYMWILAFNPQKSMLLSIQPQILGIEQGIRAQKTNPYCRENRICSHGEVVVGNWNGKIKQSLEGIRA